MFQKFAILIDGGFMKKKLHERLRQPATSHDIDMEVQRLKAHASLATMSLLRVYFYDAPPATGVLFNPIDRSKKDLSASPTYAGNVSLQQSLEMQPDMALRMGETSVRGWKLGSSALKSIQRSPRAPVANDFVPNIEQKGVDLRIGLDIARLSLRSLVDIIVVVTGDSDIVPAFKFARREGIRVYLDHMGHGVKRDLKAHADMVI